MAVLCASTSVSPFTLEAGLREGFREGEREW
jgi:hypothetical protein